MIKHPFTVRDATNPHAVETLRRVGEIFSSTLRSSSFESGPKMSGDEVILVDFGGTLRQLDWRDETGYYVTYRLHPLYSHLASVTAAADVIERRLADLFSAKVSEVTRVEKDPAGGEDSSWTTLYFRCGSHSVGD